MDFRPIPGFTKAQNDWLFQVYKIAPQAYAAAVNEYREIVQEQNVEGLGIDWGGVFSKVADAATKVATPLVQLKRQRDQLKLQKQQIKSDTAIRTTALKSGYGDPGIAYGPNATAGQSSQFPMMQTAYDPYAAGVDVPSQYRYQTPRSSNMFSQSIGGVPLWAILAGGAGLFIYLMKR